MIDFDALVLSVGQNTFGVPITYKPVTSAPGQSQFAARGVYTKRPVDVVTDHGVLQTFEHKLSVRVNEYPAVPAQGDVLFMNNVRWLVDNVEPDGQGAASLTIKIAGDALEFRLN